MESRALRESENGLGDPEFSEAFSYKQEKEWADGLWDRELHEASRNLGDHS